MSKPALFFGFRKKPGAFGLRFVLFCFVMLLGSPTTGQSETNDKLAPQDTVELHVSGWNALIGRFMEAMLINNTFTIDSAGALYLPMIGQIPAAGLREDELAKLITDRLQAMSGLHERAVTTVQRMQHPSSRASGSAERPRNGPDRPSMIVPGAKEPAGAQSSVNGSRMPGRRPGATTQQPVERERTKADALQRSPPPALMQLEMAERRAAMAARADLAAARAQAAQEASAAWRAKQAAEVLANEQSELATRQSAKVVALEQELLAARRQIDALKGSAQKPVAEREEARRALAAVQRELDAMRRVARNGSALEAARAQAAQEASAASRARQAAEVLANEQSELATRQSAKVVALEQELLAARRQIDALKGSAQKPVAEREEARRALAAVQRELDAMRRVARNGSALEVARAQAAQEASAAWRAKQAAEVLANEQSELATRQSAKVVALEQELLAARRQIDALKGSAQKPVAEREEARRALAAVQRELDAMRRVARNGSAQARAVADKQERALEGQRQIADGLARELAAVQREVEGLKAKAPLSIPAKTADVKAGLAAEAALADARRVIDHERQKAGMLERDLAAARQSLAALKATADQAAAAEATAMRDLQAAEVATKRLSEALLLQRQKADEVAGELKIARQEHDAAKQEAIRVATAQRKALEDERGKAISLARELAAARKEVDSLKARGQRGIARVENAPKARATVGASASGAIQSKPRSGRKSELREVRKTEVRRSSRSVALPTPPLPARLLPTRPPM